MILFAPVRPGAEHTLEECLEAAQKSKGANKEGPQIRVE